MRVLRLTISASSALFIVLIGIQLIAGLHSISWEWRQFKLRFGKQYATDQEEARRFAYFRENKQLMEAHNAQASTSSYRMALNNMADWSPEERVRLRGLRPLPRPADLDAKNTREFMRQLRLKDPGPAPKEVDWRQVVGRVSEVKSQGSCGSCWAFATTGVLEGQELVVNKSRKEVVSLSEQELIDCSYHDQDCQGGDMAQALNDLYKLGGIESEQDYEYKAEFGVCTIDKNKFVMSTKGALVLANITEEELAEVVAKYGPVAVGIDAELQLEWYTGGIYRDPFCLQDTPNHAVLLVGYGTNPTDGDFWIVKNSWGDKFGEQGYFRMVRGVNLCGLMQLPTIAKF